MIDHDTIQSIVGRIVKSKEFHNADKYVELLHYLVNATMTGKSIKEKDIAVEVLARGDSFNPLIDTSVRVYMYRLRKRLEDYYQAEGNVEKVHLIIPKGEYHLEFKDKLANHKKIKTLTANRPFILMTVLFVMSLAWSVYWWTSANSSRKSYTSISEDDEIWGPFLKSSMPTLLVLGDHFFFASREKNDNTTDKHIRYHRVNSMKDLEEFIEQHKAPGIKYFKDSDYFLDRYCAWSLPDLLPIFYGYHKKVDLKIASELTWTDFHNYNILFVGSFKTLGIMESLFPNLHIQYKLFPLPNKILIRDSSSSNVDEFNTFVSKTGPLFQREYSMIAKIPGPNNNVILLLNGFNYIGVENAVKLVTDPNQLSRCKKDLIKKLNEVPPYFEMVYQVEGFARTTMYSNFLRAFSIKDYNISESKNPR